MRNYITSATGLDADFKPQLFLKFGDGDDIIKITGDISVAINGNPLTEEQITFRLSRYESYLRKYFGCDEKAFEHLYLVNWVLMNNGHEQLSEIEEDYFFKKRQSDMDGPNTSIVDLQHLSGFKVIHTVVPV